MRRARPASYLRQTPSPTAEEAIPVLAFIRVGCIAVVTAVSFGTVGATALRAQSSASGVATVAVEVIPALSLSKDQDLSFGSVASGGGPVSVDPRVSAGAAKFPTSGAPNTPVTVTWSAPASLSDAGGNAVAMTAATVYGHETDAQGSSAPIVNGGAVTLSASGGFYFWVGGTIDVGAVPPGTYTGTFSMSVAY